MFMPDNLPNKTLLKIIALHGEIASQGLDLGSVMQLVGERTLELVAADGAAVELLDGDDLVYQAVAGIATPQLGLRIPRHGSLSGECICSNDVTYCADSESHPAVNVLACRQIGLRSMFVIPLRFQEQVVGVLKAMSRQVGKFSEVDRAVLCLLSDVVGAALHFALSHSTDELTRRATRDGLTGLANRELFNERLHNQLKLGQALVVLIIDLDGFKGINDRYGHLAGDAALCEVARRLKAVTRATDTAARIGGDEFAMLLNPVADGEILPALSSRVAAALQGEFIYQGQAITLAASIGAARYPQDGHSDAALLEAADRRMYQEKPQRR